MLRTNGKINQRLLVTGRVRLLMGIVFTIGLLLIVRLYVIQMMHHDYYRDRAERQYVHTAEDLFNRGSIAFLTKDGEEMSAATLKSGYLLAINPMLLSDPTATYDAISRHAVIDREKFLENASKTDRVYIEIQDRLEESVAQAIEAEGLPGVMLYKSQWRYYPGDSVAARVIGFVGYTEESPDELRGKYGLERTYDEVLRRDGSQMSVNLFAEIFGNLGSVVFSGEDKKDGSVVTTLEPTVARMLDKVLMETQEQYGSSLTGGIVMDPETGEIYALSAVPTYSLNDRGATPIETFRNPLVEDVHEMGSIVKALTVAAGLDAKVITPDSTYYDGGSIELNTFTIRNFDGRGRGTVDMQQVLSQSLNTGVAYIVTQMGKERFRKYFTDLKLGSETGIDLPNEVPGLIDNLSSPRDVEYATASFGQGIAMTPIAITRALATLGNGGHLVTPHVAKRIEYDDGTVKEIRYPEGTQVFSPETSETISRMLTAVVDEALRGGSVALPNHTIAAKTGTAQIAKPGGGYYDDRYLHSFFGYFPAYEPEFLIFLYTVEPKGVEYASETLTTPFMDLAKFLINYYNIPPDR